MTLPLALEAGLVPEVTSTTLFSGLSSSLQIGECVPKMFLRACGFIGEGSCWATGI